MSSDPNCAKDEVIKCYEGVKEATPVDGAATVLDVKQEAKAVVDEGRVPGSAPITALWMST